MYRITWLASQLDKVGYWVTLSSIAYLDTWWIRFRYYNEETGNLRLAPLKIEEVQADAAVFNGWFDEEVDSAV